MKKIFAVILVAAMATAAFGQQPEPRDGRGAGYRSGGHPMAMHQGLMAKLNLTEDQQSQMDKMRLDLEKKQTALQSKVRIAQI
jgi:Spy/CpxP family protein refolding chaperone